MSFDGEREAVGDDDEAFAVLLGGHFAELRGDAIEGFRLGGLGLEDDIDMESTGDVYLFGS